MARAELPTGTRASGGKKNPTNGSRARDPAISIVQPVQVGGKRLQSHALPTELWSVMRQEPLFHSIYKDWV